MRASCLPLPWHAVHALLLVVLVYPVALHAVQPHVLSKEKVLVQPLQLSSKLKSTDRVMLLPLEDLEMGLTDFTRVEEVEEEEVEEEEEEEELPYDDE